MFAPLKAALIAISVTTSVLAAFLALLVPATAWAAEDDSATSASLSSSDPSPGPDVDTDLGDPVIPYVDGGPNGGPFGPTTDLDGLGINPADASVLAAKEQLAAKQMNITLEQMRDTLLDPIPAESNVYEPDGGSTPAANAKVSVVGRAQGQHPWCVPASVSVTLTAFGVSTTVQQMAAALGQADPEVGATDLGPAKRALNNRQSRNRYVVSSPTSPINLLSMVRASVWYTRAPSILATHTSTLSWWRESQSQGYHALTAYGYYSAANGGLYVYDTGYAVRRTLPNADAYAGARTTAPTPPLLW